MQTKCSQAVNLINPVCIMVRAGYCSPPGGQDPAAIILIANLSSRWIYSKIGDITVVCTVNIDTIEEIQVVVTSLLKWSSLKKKDSKIERESGLL